MVIKDKSTLINEIKTLVSEKIDLKNELSDQEMREVIVNSVFEKSRESYIPMQDKRSIANEVFNSVRGLGILQSVIADNNVTEIMVNGPDNIFIEKNGAVERLGISFESREKFEDVIQTVVSRSNRMVNEASPIVDARLSDGSRLNVVLNPIALNGPIMTIRKFPENPVTIEQLVNYNSISVEAAEMLNTLVKAKYNIFICGGTGSGKTTFLNVLGNFIPPDERIITIEDSAELQIKGIENIVSMETRNENIEGKGGITIRDLIRTSLRMRPERIVVGEVRGQEALDMLQAMNTGHDGSLSTGHANSCKDMLSRLETMVLSAAPIPLEAIRQQIASAIDIIVHLSRMRDKSRRVIEISEISGCINGNIHLNELFIFEEEEGIRHADGNTVNGCLKRTGNKLMNTHKLKAAGLNIKN